VIAARARRSLTAAPGLSVGWAAFGAVVLAGALLTGFAVGPVDLGAGAILREILSHVPLLGVDSPFDDTEQAIFWQLRAPRVVLGALVGAMLASAGAGYQGVFRNPLADPYLLGAATLGTAVAVALSGLIAFVGIIVPHAIRLIAGTSYRIVLPLSIMLGGAFLVLADVLARTVTSPAELPIGVVTAFFGAPFFALLLRSTRTVGP
jgi:ABC-type Fe3+-siderophore transport system permease subunit